MLRDCANHMKVNGPARFLRNDHYQWGPGSERLQETGYRLGLGSVIRPNPNRKVSSGCSASSTTPVSSSSAERTVWLLLTAGLSGPVSSCKPAHTGLLLRCVLWAAVEYLIFTVPKELEFRLWTEGTCADNLSVSVRKPHRAGPECGLCAVPLGRLSPVWRHCRAEACRPPIDRSPTVERRRSQASA